MNHPPLPRTFYNRPAEAVARDLLNCTLIAESEDGCVAGRITETEAYTEGDAAAHSYRGVTPRTRVMFGPPGFAYIYFTYGMHYCLNVVTGEEGVGEAVLIRALEPLIGWELMQLRRGLSVGIAERASRPHVVAASALCGGPARICQSFALTTAQNGTDLTVAGTLLIEAPDAGYSASGAVMATPRIGITRDAHLLRRFVLAGDRYTSRSAADLVRAAASET